MKRIGKGMFTTAYLNDKNECILHSYDPIKEAYSESIPNKYFPLVERLWNKGYGSKFDMLHIWYKMKYFKRVKSLKKSLKPSQYKMYKELRKIDESVALLNMGGYGENVRGWKKTENLIKEVSKSNLHYSQKNIILSKIDDIKNYSDHIIMEVSPRNVACNNGNLILLDIFFCGNAHKRVTDARNKKREERHQIGAWCF